MSTRFGGGGSLWKTSWRKRTPFTEMCCFGGLGVTSQFYEELGGALDINPVTGSWIAGVVALVTVPPATPPQIIARNSDAADEGWELRYQGNANGDVVISFAVLPGAGEAEATVVNGAPIVDPLVGITTNFYRIAVFYYPAPFGGVFGSFELFVEGTSSGVVAMPSAYVNAAPRLAIGVGSGAPDTDFDLPNCMHGIAGGEGNFSNLVASPAQQWFDSVAEQHQLVAVPGVSQPGSIAVPGYSALNGWRANYQPQLAAGEGPSSLSPFIGNDPLTYGVVGPGFMIVGCTSPALFYREALASF